MHESMTSRLRRARAAIAAFRARPGRERGQVVALFALFLVVFLGFAALTIDYGSWLKVRRDYQNVVDSAVLAGSGFLSRPIDPTKRVQARRAAWESINNQLGLGLSNGQLNTLQASNTPAGSPKGNSSWIERSSADRRKVERPGMRDRRMGNGSTG